MNKLPEIIKKTAAALLQSGEATLIIGYGKGDLWWQSYPVFIREEKDIDRLIWDPFCVPNLSKYLLEEPAQAGKIALFVKGCDVLGFNQMLRDNRASRDKVLLLGLPCPGLVDPQKIKKAGLGHGLREVERQGEELLLFSDGEEKKVPAGDFLYEKCQVCRHPNPVACDRLLGEPVEVRPSPDRFNGVEELEKLDHDGRFAYWKRQFERCIRCFACRNVCPACSCRQCVFDIPEPRWLGKALELSETQFYQIIRAYHVAGRCVDCGECTRACPVGIPLRELNRKFIKDIDELYGPYEAGADPEEESPLLTYRTDDPAAFTES